MRKNLNSLTTEAQVPASPLKQFDPTYAGRGRVEGAVNGETFFRSVKASPADMASPAAGDYIRFVDVQ
jgi:hypothetical protein